MATRLNPTNFGYQNFYSATLTGDITSGTLVIGVSSVPTPSAGILVIDPDSTTNREVVLYTSKGASTVTAPSDGRGYSGSTAASHLQGTTVIMAPVDKWFTALASGELSTDSLRTELFFDYVSSGCIWSGDAYASTRNGSMTSGVIYIAGRRLTVAAVTARAFTVNKDTYIDASDNGDGTALITYTEVINNFVSGSPALAANSIRLGIIVTNATTINAAGSVNQGQEDRVLPILSSIPYAVTDSLGNLLCPRDPNRRVLGYRQITANASGTTTADIAGLSCPFIVPTGRKIKINCWANSMSSTSSGCVLTHQILEGSTVLTTTGANEPSANFAVSLNAEGFLTPSAGLHTYKVQAGASAGNLTYNAGATYPAFIKVELD